MILSIDLETYSDVDLIQDGLYKYVESPQFEILLFAYAFDDGPVKGPVEVIELATGQPLPEKVLNALTDPDIIKTAFNAQFERVCIDKVYDIKSGPWDCTMMRAWSLGFSGGLGNVGNILNIQEDQKKRETGKNLIRLFSVPQKIRKTNQIALIKQSPKARPEDWPDEWADFVLYCAKDVEAERAIREKLVRFPVPAWELALYELDQRINDRGVRIDLELARAAIAIDQEQTDRLTKKYQEITGLENPNSLKEMKDYIREKSGKWVTSITKDNIKSLMAQLEDHPDIVTALDIRQALSRTSVAKYQRMIEVVNRDDRARGLLQMYGANRTGRWAGRRIQVQNLPGHRIKDLATARQLVRTGDLDLLEMMYDSPSSILSQCIRTAIVPEPGKLFLVSDFSSIEPRVIAWMAGEDWVLDVFRTHGKIYEATAARMFKVPVESIDKSSPLRQKGKVATLACGYQGGVGALKQMGALAMGLKEDELQGIINQWRGANKRIVRLWYDIGNACKQAIEDRTTVRIRPNLTAVHQSGVLFIELPSGRRLSYPKPRIVPHHEFDGDKIIFSDWQPNGVEMTVDTYGGKLTENIIQAIARDCLADAMLRLDRAGYKLVMHVHDEVVIEIDTNTPEKELNRINEIMSEEISWAPGLPLTAAGFYTSYYSKD